jgi:hypothetical protein
LGLGFGHSIFTLGEIIGENVLPPMDDAKNDKSVLDEAEVNASTSVGKRAQAWLQPVAGRARIPGSGELSDFLFDILSKSLGRNRVALF